MDARIRSLGFLIGIMVVMTSASKLVHYKYFDEYLIRMDKKQQTILVEEIEVKVANPLPFRAGYKHNKDEKCCMLGHVAGNKGFHCFAPFYAKRIRFRNYNRAHNKKIVALLRGRPDPTSEKLMKTFEQCIDNRGLIFQKCCRYASLSNL